MDTYNNFMEAQKMVLKFKNRSKNPRKKILIYGLDGTGKSSYAAKYCKEHNLSPLCLDIDDTNFTDIPILDLNLGNDIGTYNSIKRCIEEISSTDEFDTIIIDGVTSLLEMLVSNKKGMAAYSDRSKRWNNILFQLENSKKHLIFIGQIDMEMLFTDDYQPSKAVIKVNSLVNEKYKCFISEKGDYEVEVKKFRSLEQIEAEVSAASKPSDFKPANEHKPEKTNAEFAAQRIINKLRVDGEPITLPNAKKVLMDKIMEDKISVGESNDIWAAIEVLLNGS